MLFDRISNPTNKEELVLHRVALVVVHVRGLQKMITLYSLKTQISHCKKQQ